MAGKDAAAVFAGRVIEATLGVEVEPWDTEGRQGAHDLRFTRRGRRVAVEVKRVVDPTYRAAESEAFGQDAYTTDDRLTSSWMVSLDHTASWKDARKELPAILSRLESLDWPGGPVWEVRGQAPSLYPRLEELQVRVIGRGPATERHPPGFYVTPRGWGGAPPNIETMPLFVSELLTGENMETLRRQLRDADADERHAFLVLGWENIQWLTLTERSDALPSAAPDLPHPIDGVWLTGQTTDSRVIAWLPEDGWLNGTKP